MPLMDSLVQSRFNPTKPRADESLAELKIAYKPS